MIRQIRFTLKCYGIFFFYRCVHVSNTMNKHQPRQKKTHINEQFSILFSKLNSINVIFFCLDSSIDKYIIHIFNTETFCNHDLIYDLSRMLIVSVAYMAWIGDGLAKEHAHLK